MATIAQETTRTILGVPGRAFDVITWHGNGSAKAPNEIANQKWISERRALPRDPDGLRVQAEIRFDDNCKNGHKSFAITGETTTPRGRVESCGCIHDDIAKAFPELVPLIQWHLMNETGPMHYAANVCYHAGNRDCHGKLENEPYGWRYALTFGENPILHKFTKEHKFLPFLQDSKDSGYDFEVIQLDHAPEPDGRRLYRPKFTFGGYGKKWHEGPFDSELDAVAFLHALQNCEPHFTQYATQYGEGKARDLDAARNAAIWPDASDADLSVSRSELESALTARLPAIVAEFRGAMIHDCGFIWDAPQADGESI